MASPVFNRATFIRLTSTVPPIAPAIANALFKLNGKRLRSLPFSDALA